MAGTTSERTQVAFLTLVMKPWVVKQTMMFTWQYKCKYNGFYDVFPAAEHGNLSA
jgi:hypothetical protein